MSTPKFTIYVCIFREDDRKYSRPIFFTPHLGLWAQKLTFGIYAFVVAIKST